MTFQETIQHLPLQHQQALRWFVEHAGAEVPWTPTADDGTRIFCRPKGIYKPAGNRYALSVRQTLEARYLDREPIWHDDGSWTYAYHQEGEDPEERDRHYTNKAMMKCLQDKVPVGVARQCGTERPVRYRILGAAMVSDWRDGFFRLDGFSPSGDCSQSRFDGPLSAELQQAESTPDVLSSFDPASVEDSRQKALVSIARRRGQKRFRGRLLKIYGGRCVVTSCAVEAVLEAAHITPYLGPATNTPQNGLLLRADIHTLWDLGLIAIDEVSGKVILSRQLSGTDYEGYGGNTVAPPVAHEDRPSLDALKAHREQAALSRG